MHQTTKHLIGIVGAPNERHCLYLAQELRTNHAVEPLILNNAPDIPFPLSLHGSTVCYEDVPLDELHVLYMRALFLPTPAFDAGEIEARMKKYGYVAYAAHRERYAAWLSYLKTASLSGKLVVNPIDSLLLHFAKPYQTELLRSKGLPVPDTLVTSSAQLLLDFCKDKEVVYKPVAGGALCRKLTEEDKQPERLQRLASAPVQFQEYVPGHDLRVFVLDGRVIASFLLESDHIDFREGEAELTKHTLDPEIAAVCIRACRELGLLFSGVDLKLRADGSVVLIECNPSPMFEGFDRILSGHERIVSQLADYLTEQARTAANGAPSVL